MLHYAVLFFIIALIAALLGFGGIAASAAAIGKILFVLFALLAVGSFLYGLIREGGEPTGDRTGTRTHS